MSKALAYIGGIVMIVGATSFLLGNVTTGSGAVAVGLVCVMSGWVNHFKNAQEPLSRDKWQIGRR